MSNQEADYKRMSPRDKLSTARLKARQDSPYFASALLGLIPREAPGLGTLGVTEKMLLMWDPVAIQDWPLAELSATLEHEVMHVLRNHHARARRLGVIDDQGRPIDPDLAKLWNLAGDAELNDDFEVTRPALFVEPRVSFLPKHVGMENGLLAESYYDELRNKSQQSKKLGGEGKGRARAGRCGSCAGNPNEGEPRQGVGLGKEQKPSAGEGRSEAEVDRIRKQVARDVQDHAAKGRGNIPGGWLRWAEEALSPPKIDWRTKLQRLVRAGVAWRAGQVDLHHDRTSRRQWGIGIGPGRPIIPALRAPEPLVAVACDTSGSMSEAEIHASLSEVSGILATTNARVTFLACDAVVHTVAEVRTINDLKKHFKGGGGTDFVPIFEAIAKMPRHKRPAVVVVCTDGDGPAPAHEPPGIKTVWVLTGAHARKPCEWGTHVFTDR